MNILVTNFQNSSEDVMIFTDSLTVETVKTRLDERREFYEEIYAVPSNDLQYYLYDPCWID